MSRHKILVPKSGSGLNALAIGSRSIDFFHHCGKSMSATMCCIDMGAVFFEFVGN